MKTLSEGTPVLQDTAGQVMVKVSVARRYFSCARKQAR